MKSSQFKNKTYKQKVHSSMTKTKRKPIDPLDSKDTSKTEQQLLLKLPITMTLLNIWSQMFGKIQTQRLLSNTEIMLETRTIFQMKQLQMVHSVLPKPMKPENYLLLHFTLVIFH